MPAESPGFRIFAAAVRKLRFIGFGPLSLPVLPTRHLNLSGIPEKSSGINDPPARAGSGMDRGRGARKTGFAETKIGFEQNRFFQYRLQH
jgi:hypothetical protein